MSFPNNILPKNIPECAQSLCFPQASKQISGHKAVTLMMLLNFLFFF